MDRKVLIVLSGVVLLTSSVVGLVLIDGGSDSHRVSTTEIDKPVSQSIEPMSYDSLSTTQQELFRNIRDTPAVVGGEPAISSGTVVQLDGQYYMVKSSVPPTLPISLATIFAFLDILFIFTSFSMFDDERIQHRFNVVMLSLILVVFSYGAWSFHPVTQITISVSEQPVVESDVESESAVIHIQDMSFDDRENVYKVMTGGSAVTKSDLTYVEVETVRGESKNVKWYFSDYSYIRSDGEVYHIQRSEMLDYQALVAGVLAILGLIAYSIDQFIKGVKPAVHPLKK